MRNVILFGASAIVLSLGAGAAYANGPGDWSPYAINEPQTTAPAPSMMSEGRAALSTGITQSTGRGIAPDGSAYDVQQPATPEDATLYSRGR